MIPASQNSCDSDNTKALAIHKILASPNPGDSDGSGGFQTKKNTEILVIPANPKSNDYNE